MILLFVLWVMIASVKPGCYKLELMHYLEYLFLIMPLIIISMLMWESLPHLYKLSVSNCNNMVMVMGYQWYWVMNNYEMYNEMNSLSINSSSSSVIVSNTEILEFTGSSNDVIHSMYIPSLFFKMDLIPGRMSTTSLEVNLMNYGVCAEICGANHAFMPFKYNVVYYMI